MPRFSRLRRFNVFDRFPWLDVVFFLALAGWLGMEIVRQELRLPPSSPGQVAALVLGLLSLPLLFLLLKKSDGAWWMVVLAIGGAVLASIGLHAGLGAQRVGLDVDPATFPRTYQAFGAGVVLGLAAAMLCFAAFIAIRIVRGDFPRRPAETASRSTHRVAVFDTRPEPGDPDPHDPYFIAICQCGWVGEGHHTSALAFRDARKHSGNVDETMRRPVG